jgi:hypothetical protein
VVMRYRSTSVYYELGLGRIPQVSEFSMEYPFFYLFKSAEISDTSPIRIREYPRGISIRYGIRHWYVSFVKYPHIIAGHRYGRTSTSCVPGLRTMLWSWVCGGGCPLGSVITSPKQSNNSSRRDLLVVVVRMPGAIGVAALYQHTVRPRR